jgi:hypothetical protein
VAVGPDLKRQIRDAGMKQGAQPEESRLRRWNQGPWVLQGFIGGLLLMQDFG